MRKAIFYGVVTLIFSINLASAQGLWQFYKHTNFERFQAANQDLSSIGADETRVVLWEILSPKYGLSQDLTY